MKIGFLFVLEIAIFFFLGGLIGGYSVYGIIKKRPVFIKNLYYFIPLIILYIGMYAYLILSGMFGMEFDIQHGITNYVYPITFTIMLLIIVIVFFKQLAGYLIFGVTDEVADVLLNVLRENNIQYQEKLSRVILPEYGTQINVAVTKWLGSAQIRIDTWKQNKVLERIVKGINKYYDNHKEKYNKWALLLYAVMGMALVIFGMILLTMLKGYMF
jgi:hypothetical protein